ncbi:unnamed protein product [Cylindrotheca closterium]|uniref:Uncharacterized protein n=1 Tax=Cylindrotheca closterium TaxID=2856 RepID=A0AAD2PW35_9STRA|nr:unnamed protein product [Cylindrotheca closterium]CAJ1959180.1 unnamed protein product [Cylindrotheca closterium]
MMENEGAGQRSVSRIRNPAGKKSCKCVVTKKTRGKNGNNKNVAGKPSACVGRNNQQYIMVAKIQRDVDVNTSAANGMSHMGPGTEYFVTLLNSFVEKYWEARLEGKQRKLCEKIVNTIQGRGGAFYKKAKGGYTRLDFESALKATDESLNEILIVKGKSKKRGKDDDIIFTATERVPKKHVVYGTNKWENSLFTPSHLSRYSDPNTSPKERGTIIQSIFEVLTNKFEKVLDPLSSNRLYVVSPCKWKEMIMGMLEDYKAEKEKYPNLVIVDAIQDDDFRPWKIDDSTKGSAIVISQVAKYNDPRASQTDKTNLLLNVSRRIEAGGGKIFEPLLRFNQYREIDPRFAVGTLQRFVERHTAFKMRMLRSEKYENNLFRAEAIGAKDVLYGSVL